MRKTSGRLGITYKGRSCNALGFGFQGLMVQLWLARVGASPSNEFATRNCALDGSLCPPKYALGNLRVAYTHGQHEREHVTNNQDDRMIGYHITRRSKIIRPALLR